MDLIKEIFPGDDDFIKKIEDIKEATIQKWRRGYKGSSGSGSAGEGGRSSYDKNSQSSNILINNPEKETKIQSQTSSNFRSASTFVTDKPKTNNNFNNIDNQKVSSVAQKEGKKISKLSSSTKNKELLYRASGSNKGINSEDDITKKVNEYSTKLNQEMIKLVTECKEKENEYENYYNNLEEESDEKHNYMNKIKEERNISAKRIEDLEREIFQKISSYEKTLREDFKNNE